MSEAKKRGLGRGLSALLGEDDEDVGVAVAAGGEASTGGHPGPGGTTQLNRGSQIINGFVIKIAARLEW